MAERLTAEDLIEKKRKQGIPKIPDALLQELKKVVEYNDQCAVNGARVSRDDVIEMCDQQGVHGLTTRKLDAVAREYMERKGFGTK